MVKMKSVLSRFSGSMSRKYTSLNLSTVRFNHLLLQRFFHCNFLLFFIKLHHLETLGISIPKSFVVDCC